MGQLERRALPSEKSQNLFLPTLDGPPTTGIRCTYFEPRKKRTKLQEIQFQMGEYMIPSR